MENKTYEEARDARLEKLRGDIPTWQSYVGFDREIIKAMDWGKSFSDNQFEAQINSLKEDIGFWKKEAMLQADAKDQFLKELAELNKQIERQNEVIRTYENLK